MVTDTKTVVVISYVCVFYKYLAYLIYLHNSRFLICFACLIYLSNSRLLTRVKMEVLIFLNAP